MTHLLYSLITLFIAFFFILLGFIGIILPWSTGMQNITVNFILNNSILIFLFGFCALLIGAITAINILFNMRRQYYYFKVGSQTVSVDSTVIQTYLQKYLKELFPAIDVPYQLQLKKNKIHVVIDLPYIEPSQQNATLERLQSELRDLFQSLLGYRHQFHLSASFQSAPK